MSFQAMSLVSSLKIHDCICSQKKFLLLAMANYADDKFELWPSYQTLADFCVFNRSTAIRHVNGLIKIGIIKAKKRRIDNKLSKSNIYTLEIIAWMQSNNYKLSTNEKGFICVDSGSGTAPPLRKRVVAEEDYPSGTAPPLRKRVVAEEDYPSGTAPPPLVAERDYPSGTAPPNPVSEPVIQPIIDPEEKIILVSSSEIQKINSKDVGQGKTGKRSAASHMTDKFWEH